MEGVLPIAAPCRGRVRRWTAIWRRRRAPKPRGELKCSTFFFLLSEFHAVALAGSKTRMWFGLGLMLAVCLLEDNMCCTTSVTKPNTHALATRTSVRHDHERAIGL
jgi:hypothetical protein